jgi:hypothetical protein
MKRTTLLLVATLVLAPAPAGADMLNASRFIQRVQATNGGLGIATMQQATLVKYCGDSDGCKISLKLADGFSIEAKTSRLFLDETNPLKWVSEGSPVAGMHIDADGNVDAAVPGLWLSFSNCGFADMDAGGTENAAGFTLGVVAGAGLTATCTLVVED